jgi:hypothetical protein
VDLNLAGLKDEELSALESVREIVTRLNDPATAQALKNMIGAHSHWLRRFSIPTALNVEEIRRRM